MIGYRIEQVVKEVWLDGNVKRATAYIKPNLTIKATAHGRAGGRDVQRVIVVTIGRPNHSEREFIKACRKSGEGFPVRRIQLRFWPKGR